MLFTWVSELFPFSLLPLSLFQDKYGFKCLGKNYFHQVLIFINYIVPILFYNTDHKIRHNCSTSENKLFISRKHIFLQSTSYYKCIKLYYRNAKLFFLKEKPWKPFIEDVTGSNIFWNVSLFDRKLMEKCYTYRRVCFKHAVRVIQYISYVSVTPSLK